MILSVSRRTDIPAFYSQWFENRLREKYVLVRNPRNPRQISRISLSPDVVDCIVFWSKNPAPMLPRLKELREYLYYFQFTLNPYGTDIERNLPPLLERVRTFRELSLRLGKKRVAWRYDPVLLGGRYSLKWHEEQFSFLAKALSPYTERCVFSFLDWYPSISKRLLAATVREPSQEEQLALAKRFSDIARSFGLSLFTCTEKLNLEHLSILHGSCIDAGLIEELLGCPIRASKDKNQRGECGCVSSIDLGLYHTCPNGCVYCYANPYGRPYHASSYDPSSPLLCSRLLPEDQVSVKKMASLKEPQMRLPL